MFTAEGPWPDPFSSVRLNSGGSGQEEAVVGQLHIDDPQGIPNERLAGRLRPYCLRRSSPLVGSYM